VFSQVWFGWVFAAVALTLTTYVLSHYRLGWFAILGYTLYCLVAGVILSNCYRIRSNRRFFAQCGIPEKDIA
jgi:hypothetical protein